MKIFTTLCLIFLSCSAGYSQKKKLVFYGTNMQQMISSAYYVIEEEESFNLYHYRYNAWHPGRLEFIDGSIKEDVYLNYNLLKGTVEELADGKLQVYSMYQVKRFEIADYDLNKYVTYLGVNALVEDEGTRAGFVRLAADGTAKLVERSYFKASRQSSGPYYYLNDGEVEKARQYYLYEHNVLKPLRKAATFSGRKQQIRAFVKAAGLHWHKEADLVQIVAQYNALNNPVIPLDVPLVAF